MEENKEQLITTEKYEIFTIVEDITEGIDVKIVLGNYMVKNGFESIENAKAYIDSKPWELISAVTSIYTMYTIKQINENENEKRNSKRPRKKTS